MNLNKFAVFITKQEGKKVSLPISQVKEVIKLVLKELSYLSVKELADLMKQIK